MKFHISVELNVPLEEFWKFRSHSDLLEVQMKHGDLDRIETVEEGVQEDGMYYRKMHIFPKMEFLELSETIRKHVEQNFTGLHDYQSWREDGSFVQYFETRPLGFLADRVLTKGNMTLTKVSEKVCQYTLEGNVKVRFLGLGPIVELFVVQNMKRFYRGGFRDSIHEFFSNHNSLREKSKATKNGLKRKHKADGELSQTSTHLGKD
eukprot:jgi/Galph1/3270/GphlegSOOS_G1927.1